MVGLPVVVDVWDPGEVDRLSRNADALQVPSPQMQDAPLVRAAGQGDRPVFIARGPSATIEEWLLAGERVLQEGNRKVALVEQGVRTFETAVRAMLDLNAVAVARRLSHLPVLVNPSLAAGQAEIVADLALAAAATGCEGDPARRGHPGRRRRSLTPSGAAPGPGQAARAAPEANARGDRRLRTGTSSSPTACRSVGPAGGVMERAGVREGPGRLGGRVERQAVPAIPAFLDRVVRELGPRPDLVEQWSLLVERGVERHAAGVLLRTA